MAVSKIWKVTARLDQVIDYATNPEKTAAKDYSPEQFQALADVLRYAKDEEKTAANTARPRQRHSAPQSPRTLPPC